MPLPSEEQAVFILMLSIATKLETLIKMCKENGLNNEDLLDKMEWLDDGVQLCLAQMKAILEKPAEPKRRCF